MKADKVEDSKRISYDKALECLEKGECDEAMRLLRTLSAEGYVMAKETLSFLYYAGQCVEKNMNESICLDEEAAESGSTISIFSLGITYKNKGDMSGAERWFRRGVDLRDSSSAIELAEIYATQAKETDAIILLDMAEQFGNLSDDEKINIAKLRTLCSKSV